MKEWSRHICRRVQNISAQQHEGDIHVEEWPGMVAGTQAGSRASKQEIYGRAKMKNELSAEN